MRRIYTLRQLFVDSIRGQANLDEAIKQGNAPTRWVATLAAFWVKVNNDWIFNLSGLLAYNFLFALFPILILTLSITGFVLSHIAPGTEDLIVANISRALPSPSSPTRSSVSATSRCGGGDERLRQRLEEVWRVGSKPHDGMEHSPLWARGDGLLAPRT